MYLAYKTISLPLIRVGIRATSGLEYGFCLKPVLANYFLSMRL
jgi:hypothetical protein